MDLLKGKDLIDEKIIKKGLKMRCIFLKEPGVPGVANSVTKRTCGIGTPYEIEGGVYRKYCRTDKFVKCPRYRAYLETEKLKKKEEIEIR